MVIHLRLERNTTMAQLVTHTDTGIPRPEHPFPQMVRAEWVSLNGVWDFAETDADNETPSVFPDHIRVPFCRGRK